MHEKREKKDFVTTEVANIATPRKRLFWNHKRVFF